MVVIPPIGQQTGDNVRASGNDNIRVRPLSAPLKTITARLLARARAARVQDLARRSAA
jgi:hypothetical protein